MYTHLHLHTEYSLLDGLCRIQPLMERARALGMGSIAVTDHGNLYSAVDFYSAAKDFGLKPIIGCEAYVAPTHRESRTPGDKSPYHLTLLAKNDVGYKNLIQLITKANLEGFYYKPRVDRELLEEHHEGLIVLSGCPTAEIPRLIMGGRTDDAIQSAKWFREVFDDFYLEIQHHDLDMLTTINQGLVSIGGELDIPLVATNDVHYIHQADAVVQDILLCIQTNTTVLDEKRLKMSDDSLYLKTPKEMAELFSDFPQAIENTNRIADACSISMEFDRLRLPLYETPNGEDADEYLEQLCKEGLRRLIPDAGEDVQRRLTYELDVIRHTRFANYFLVVRDIIGFTRESRILFGVRGSAAASLVLYCLGVTDINPLAYRLVFERFLNLERKEMPDIDLDFQDDRRDEVISYVTRKYGADHVAQIITFGTLGARASLRDVGRALGMPYSLVDNVAKQVPFGVHSIAEAMEASPDLTGLYEQDHAIQKLVDMAQKLEGVARHASTHAAGVVISQEPLTDYVPLQRGSKGGAEDIPVTQFAMAPIAKLGLLKMDFLGLVNLTILGRALEIISRHTGEKMELPDIPLDDELTFRLLSTGETTGIFQLESGGMRRYIKQLKPNTVNDVAAMIALYRPGPMEHISTFIKAKHDEESAVYPHPSLKDILEETYGVIVYQDQVLLILQTFAGYSLGQADVVRKAMGKKIASLMLKERERFIEGAVVKGFTRDLAGHMFNLIEPFAGYAFNKAHSVSYAMISYWTAYLKANYPAQFMTALLSCHLGQADKTASAVEECRKLKIPVLAPDVNRSGLEFTIESNGDGHNSIRFGLAAVKNVGPGAVKPLLEAREPEGPFKSIEDLCRRADLRSLNKRALESLIKVGALDSLGDRGVLLGGAERILSMSRREWELKGSNQSTMFDLWGATVATPLPSLQLDGAQVESSEKEQWERELLGASLSESAISRAHRSLSNSIGNLCGEIDIEMVDKRVSLVGQVASFRVGTTRKGDPFGAAVLQDMTGSVEVMAWREVYERTHDLWAAGAILKVEGKVRARNGDRISVHCSNVQKFEPPSDEPEEVESNLPLDGQKPLETVEGPVSQTSTPAPAQTPAPAEAQAPAPAYPQPSTSTMTQVQAAAQTPALAQAPAAPIDLWLRIRATGDEAQDMERLRSAISLARENPGRDGLYLEIEEGQNKVRLDLPDLKIGYSEELHNRFASLLGVEMVKVVKAQ